MPSLTVELGERSYKIETGRDLSDMVAAFLEPLRESGRKFAVVIDRNVAAAQPVFLEEALGDCPHLVLPAGEKTKSFVQLERICEFLARKRIDRGGLLVAFGGGVIGDLAGFAAASYLRGIPYIQVPTTLLAMVDSSVGGKTGVNLTAGKNLVGAFWQPQGVYADVAMLDTLPKREFSAGMAEVIKYGMLADAPLFHRLESLPVLNSHSAELPGIINRSCEIKAAIVREDERETAASGGRALLNLGHTFAHAIENVAGYGKYLHGEAVAIGLVMAARLSEELGFIQKDDVTRVRELIRRYELPLQLRSPLLIHKLVDAMRRDKKVKAGKLRFVTMKTLGEAQTTPDIESTLIRTIWREHGAV